MGAAFKCVGFFATDAVALSSCPLQAGIEGGAVIGGKGDTGADEPVVAGTAFGAVVEVEAVAGGEGEDDGVYRFVSGDSGEP